MNLDLTILALSGINSISSLKLAFYVSNIQNQYKKQLSMPNRLTKEFLD